MTSNKTSFTTVSTDYGTAVRVNASADAVFDAITTPEGIAGWWWPGVNGSGESNGDLIFDMGAPRGLVIHVDQALRPKSVQWRVTECAVVDDWVGTRPSFTVEEIDETTTELRFDHQGLTPELECFEMCKSSWNHYVTASLRTYLEDGKGSPNGSSVDNERRVAEGWA